MFRTSLRFRATLLPLLLTLLAVIWTLPSTAQTGDLDAALRATPPGGVLELPGGDWGTLRLNGSGGPSIIRSADPANPARISRMDIKGAENLTLQSLVLKYDWSPDDTIRLRPFGIVNSRNVRLLGLRIVGDVAGAGNSADRGFPWGIGLSIRNSQDVTLENSEVATFNRGMAIRDSDRIAILGNNVHGLRVDGMNFAAVQGVRIEGNHIHDFARSVNSKDHADMIQFWTNRTDRPSTDIVIRSNLLNSGRGAFTQSIFMRNDLVDRGLAGPEMFYRNILIEENIILNAHLHGITVGETQGLVIRSNTVVHNPLGAGENPTRNLWLPQIKVSGRSRDVDIEGNIAAAFPDQQRGWKMADNLIVQPHSVMGTNHYARVFAGFPDGNPSDPASYRLRASGPGNRTGLGATRLRLR